MTQREALDEAFRLFTDVLTVAIPLEQAPIVITVVTGSIDNPITHTGNGSCYKSALSDLRKNIKR